MSQLLCSDASEIHLAVVSYLESKYASSLHPFYQSLGYHYCNARGHHENAFKFTLKAADWTIRKHSYEVGLENLRIASSITRSTTEMTIVLEVLNRTIRELVRKVEMQASSRSKNSPQSTRQQVLNAAGSALVLGMNGKKAVSLGSSAPVGEESTEVRILRKYRELKNEIDAQILANESQLANQRLQAMNNPDKDSHSSSMSNLLLDNGAPGRLGLGKKQISFVSGFGETDNSMINTPGPLKWQLSFGDMSRIQKQGSVSNLNGNYNSGLIGSGGAANSSSGSSRRIGGMLESARTSFKGLVTNQRTNSQKGESKAGEKKTTANDTVVRHDDLNGEGSPLRATNSSMEPWNPTLRCSPGISCTIC
jgi:hypothetical protein